MGGLGFTLVGAVRGGVFAAGHAGSGNDIPLLLSTTKAERVDGGYRFTGRKGIHPANSMLTHEIVAKTVLSISPDETPRWG